MRLFFNMLIVVAFTAILSVTITGCNQQQDDQEVLSQPDTEIVATDSAAADATSAGTCQCVGYVKNQLGITSSTANAKDWGTVYTPPGYVVVPGGASAWASVGDLVVMLGGFGNGVSTAYGHIGILQSITYNSNGSYTIKLRAANQSSTGLVTEASCTNVNTWTVTIDTQTEKNNIRFLRKQTAFSYASMGFFPTGASATQYSPALGVYTNCNNSTQTSCGYTYQGAIGKVKVLSVNPRFIRLRLEKCSGTFIAGGTVFVKDGSSPCGTIVGADYYQTGWSYREITIRNTLTPGQWKTFTLTGLSSNGTRFWMQSVQVKG